MEKVKGHLFVSFVRLLHLSERKGFPGGLVVKNLPANAGDLGSVPGLGRSPGGGHGNPLQCSCLENSMDRSLVGSSPWVGKELDVTEHT